MGLNWLEISKSYRPRIAVTLPLCCEICHCKSLPNFWNYKCYLFQRTCGLWICCETEPKHEQKYRKRLVSSPKIIILCVQKAVNECALSKLIVSCCYCEYWWFIRCLLLASYFMSYHSILKTSADYTDALRSARRISESMSQELGHEVFPYR